MYLKISRNAKGRASLSICEKYRDPITRKPKDRIIRSLGFADTYDHLYDDPIAHFRDVVKQMNEEQKHVSSLSVLIDMDEALVPDSSDLKNVGYGFIKRIYKALEIDKFWKGVAKKENTNIDLEKIFSLLVFMRIIRPGSKKDTYEHKDMLFESFEDIKLDDVYRALDYYTKYDAEFQVWLYDHSAPLYKRNIRTTYFDCTNYYYDISKPDIDELDEDGNILKKRYRKYGPEKNHRKDPIIEMGLLIDADAIPLSYGLFPGNESEKVNMLPIIKKAKSRFGLERTIVVADRGLNTSDNIFYLNGNNKKENNPRDGYVYGQSIRGADKEFKKWCIDPEGYQNDKITDGCDTIIFRHKSRIYPKTIHVNVDKDTDRPKKKEITVDQKQMVYYSQKYAEKQALERQRAIQRAEDLIRHPKKYDKVSAKGASGYVKNIAFNKETGEVIDLNLKLDVEKIEEESKYDGYYSIVTSELNMSDIEIRKIYKGLSRIEETFRITKSELDTRPIHVTTNEHIESHFTTCFAAITLLRLLEISLGNKYPAPQIIESLRQFNCVNISSNIYRMTYTNEILKQCGALHDIVTGKKHRTKEEMRRILKYCQTGQNITTQRKHLITYRQRLSGVFLKTLSSS